MELTAAAAWLNTTFDGFDKGVTTAIHKIYEVCGSVATPVMELISLLGAGGIALIVLSLILLVIRKTRRFGTAMILGLAIGAIVVNLWLKVVVARPRPYADVNGFYYPLWQLMGAHTESDYSFPSGHTNAAFACMVPAFLIGKKSWSWLCLLFGFLMGVSRIYLVVHYPSDVLGGIITGTIAGLLGYLIMTKLPEKWYGWSLKKDQRVKGAHE